MDRCKKDYYELMQLKTYEERFNYLKEKSVIGFETFGSKRYINQKFYSSYEWRKVRAEVIMRDNCCDLALPDHPIYGRVFVHHINPLEITDILNGGDVLLLPKFLITVSEDTHKRLHFSSDPQDYIEDEVERKPNDTIPWKNIF